MGHYHRHSYTPHPLVGSDAKPFAKVGEIEEIIKEFAPNAELHSKVFPPRFRRFARTEYAHLKVAKESPIHKAYHLDGMSVLLQVELGYKFATGLESTSLHLVTVEENEVYKKKIEVDRRKVAARHKPREIILKSRAGDKPYVTKEVKGPIVESSKDKTLQTARVVGLKAQYDSIDVDDDIFKAPGWRDLISGITKKYAVKIGPVNVFGNSKGIVDEGIDIYSGLSSTRHLQRGVITSMGAVKGTLQAVYSAGTTLRDAVEEEKVRLRSHL